MRINADFSLPALVLAEQQQWIASPQVGVERVMLDRIGLGESASDKFGALCRKFIFSGA